MQESLSNSIISKTFENIQKEVISMLIKLYSQIENLSDFSKIIDLADSEGNALKRKIVETMMNLKDSEYAASREDKSEIIITHSKAPKSIVCVFGTINLKRNRYFNKNTKEKYYLVDKVYNLDNYQRIDKGLQAKLIEEATCSSYRKTSKIYNYNISHQGVYNTIKKCYSEYEKIQQKIEESDTLKIYIEADEDHVHMKNGTNRMAKLVYVHEGYEPVSYSPKASKRYKLKNAKYFFGVQGRDIWEDVQNYVYTRYKLYTKIRLSGDGAYWIKRGLNYFPLAEFNLDKFHIMQTITRLYPRNQEKREELLDAIISKDKKYLLDLYEKRYGRLNNSLREKSQQTMTGLLYLINNFENIYLTDSEKKCSAEGHISHILSERLSSRPKAWTHDGLDRIGVFRCEKYNNFDFSSIFENTKKDIEVVNS